MIVLWQRPQSRLTIGFGAISTLRQGDPDRAPEASHKRWSRTGKTSTYTLTYKKYEAKGPQEITVSPNCKVSHVTQKVFPLRFQKLSFLQNFHKKLNQTIPALFQKLSLLRFYLWFYLSRCCNFSLVVKLFCLSQRGCPPHFFLYAELFKYAAISWNTFLNNSELWEANSVQITCLGEVIFAFR